MTLILAAIHAFRTNKDFNPAALYLVTCFLDGVIISEVTMALKGI